VYHGCQTNDEVLAAEGNVMVDREELLTTSDAAKVLQVSTDWVRELERQGRLPALKTRSGQRLFFVEDVERLAQARDAKRMHETSGTPA
jgi:excisionase family DNA binding protein